jgi:hypothetical protein
MSHPPILVSPVKKPFHQSSKQSRMKKWQKYLQTSGSRPGKKPVRIERLMSENTVFIQGELLGDMVDKLYPTYHIIYIVISQIILLIV